VSVKWKASLAAIEDPARLVLDRRDILGADVPLRVDPDGGDVGGAEVIFREIFVAAFLSKAFTIARAGLWSCSGQNPSEPFGKCRDHGAWITFDGDIRSYECRVPDVSAGGAKLLADVDALVGSSLRLSVAPYSLVRKPCEVVWRKGRQLGVKFKSEAVAGLRFFSGKACSTAREGRSQALSPSDAIEWLLRISAPVIGRGLAGSLSWPKPSSK
jgi:hypothetical protein